MNARVTSSSLGLLSLPTYNVLVTWRRPRRNSFDRSATVRHCSAQVRSLVWLLPRRLPLRSRRNRFVDQRCWTRSLRDRDHVNESVRTFSANKLAGRCIPPSSVDQADACAYVCVCMCVCVGVEQVHIMRYMLRSATDHVTALSLGLNHCTTVIKVGRHIATARTTSPTATPPPASRVTAVGTLRITDIHSGSIDE